MSIMSASDRQHAGVALRQVAAAQFTFYSALIVSQRLQLALGVSTGTRMLGCPLFPSLLGAATIGCGSLASLQAAKLIAPHGSKSPEMPSVLSVGLAGAGLYLTLGGRFWAIAPSSLTSLGAFARPRVGSLPATRRYATPSERRAIQQLGRRFGCHSCGRTGTGPGLGPAIKFNADHMPPLWEARRADQDHWRRLLRRPIQLRFFPQCVSCSGAQAVAVAAMSTGRSLPAAARTVCHPPRLGAASSYVGGLLATLQLTVEANWRRSRAASPN